MQEHRASTLLELFDILSDVPETARILRLEQVDRQIAGTRDRQVLGLFTSLWFSPERSRADRQQATQRAADWRR